MSSLRAKNPQGRVKFNVGVLVMITKDKVNFAKVYERTFSTEISRLVNVIQRLPQTVYELTHLQDRPIECQFKNYESVKVTVFFQTEFQIHNLLPTRNKNGIK